jgi:putative transcriptional regulator
MDIEKVAKAIEDDAGEPLADLRQALEEAKAKVGRVTTPGQIAERTGGESSAQM